MTLLTICQGAARKIGLPNPNAIITSNDPQVKELLSFAEMTGDELMESYQWEILTKEASFTTVAAESQGTLASIASDYNRIIDQSMWDRTGTRRVRGPLDAFAWQRVKGSTTDASIEYWFRIRGGELLFWPEPPAGSSVYFEYISKNWVNGASPSDSFAADTDATYLDERLIEYGVIWRFLKQKGMPYEDALAEFRNRREKLLIHDKGNPILSMDAGPDGTFTDNIPESNWTTS